MNAEEALWYLKKALDVAQYIIVYIARNFTQPVPEDGKDGTDAAPPKLLRDISPGLLQMLERTYNEHGDGVKTAGIRGMGMGQTDCSVTGAICHDISKAINRKDTPMPELANSKNMNQAGPGGGAGALDSKNLYGLFANLYSSIGGNPSANSKEIIGGGTTAGSNVAADIGGNPSASSKEITGGGTTAGSNVAADIGGNSSASSKEITGGGTSADPSIAAGKASSSAKDEAASHNAPVKADSPSKGSFRYYAEKWLGYIEGEVKHSSYMKYRNLLRTYILPILGNIDMESLDAKSVETFRDRMLSANGIGKTGEGLSQKTVSDAVSIIRRVLHYAVEHGAVMVHDISSVTVKKARAAQRVLTPNEQNKLISILDPVNCKKDLGLLIGLCAGTRVGEICALKWRDISSQEQAIHVGWTLQRVQFTDNTKRRTKVVLTTPKSANSVRSIPLPDGLAKLLEACRRGEDTFVLSGKERKFVEPRAMERHLEKRLEQAGIEHINFHALRHTFATRCVEMGFDIRSLSEILGHADVDTTLSRYVHPTMEMKRANVQKLSAILDGSLTALLNSI